jgi:hypothetical protein
LMFFNLIKKLHYLKCRDISLGLDFGDKHKNVKPFFWWIAGVGECILTVYRIWTLNLFFY